jgi:stage II sporulation protein D
MRARSLDEAGLRVRGPELLAGIVAGVMAVSTVLVAGAAPADARRTRQTYRVPESKVLVVQGHGYGHGHGMSQYGAYGAAKQGLSHEEILDFYYPGTSPGTARGRVRVLISADTTRDVVVSPAEGLNVWDRGDRTTHLLPDIEGVTRWRLTVRGGRAVVQYRTDSAAGWHRYEPDGKKALVGEGQFRAKEPLTLWTPSGPREYRGALRMAHPREGSRDRDTVNILSLDKYIQGVIPHEMPPSWHPEAVQAQAVAARTYAAWSRAQSRGRYYQICDTTACQVYGGAGAEHPASNDAVRQTRREIRIFEGAPAFTQFSASSGGWTSAGSRSYLPAQPDPYDDHAANPVHTWEIEVDAAELERKFPALGRLRAIRVVRRDGNGDWQGRVWKIVLDGTRADRTMSGDDFRWTFGLRSSWFTIR